MTLEYNPNRVTILAGTAGGQDYKETYHDDANVYEITEVTGTPGFEVILDFDGFRVDSDFVNHFKLEIVGRYGGGPVHNKKIYIYNWITDTWDAFTSRYDDLPNASAEGTYTFLKEMGNGLQEKYNGKVRIKIRHDSPSGAAGHKLYLNRVKLSGIILGVIEGAGQFSGINFGTGILYSTTTTTTTTTTQQMIIANSGNDGYIQYYNAIDFATAHDAETGLGISLANTRTTSAAGINYAGPTDYSIARSFFDFLLGLDPGVTIVGAELHIYGYFQGGQEVCIQEGSQAAPPVLADYDSFTGPSLGNVATWDDADWNIFTLNAAGLAYLNSVKTGTAKIVLREYDSDFLNVDYAADSELGMYYADDAVLKPFIVVYYTS